MSNATENLQAFTKALKLKSSSDITLAIAYFLDKYKSQSNFSVAELSNSFVEARMPIPTNPYDVVAKLIKVF